MTFDDFPTTGPADRMSDYDWEEAFGYADGYSNSDVAEVLTAWADSPEGYGSLNMAALFRLADGRYATLTAWADTTGWGCQEGGRSYVTATLQEAVDRGLTEEERGLLRDQLLPLGVSLDPQDAR